MIDMDKVQNQLQAFDRQGTMIQIIEDNLHVRTRCELMVQKLTTCDVIMEMHINQSTACHGVTPSMNRTPDSDFLPRQPNH
jgi:hypothetical protein